MTNYFSADVILCNGCWVAILLIIVCLYYTTYDSGHGEDSEEDVV